MSTLATQFRARLRAAVIARQALDGVEFTDVLEGPFNIDLTLKVLRPADLVVLNVKLVNLHRRGDRFERRDSSKPARLVVEHQPQSFGEQAFPEAEVQGSQSDDDASGMIEPSRDSQIAMSGPSRVAHLMPDDVASIPATLASVLSALRTWPLALHDNALPDTLRWGLEDASGFAGLARASTGLRVDERVWREVDFGIGVIVESIIAGARQGRVPSTKSIETRIEALASKALPPRRGEDTEITTDRTTIALYAQTRVATGWSSAVQQNTDLQTAAEGFDFAGLGAMQILRRPRAPGTSVTALEMPLRLIASPLPGAGFTHADEPVTHEGRTELWHSRLGSRVEAGGKLQRVNDEDGVAEGTGWNGQRLRFLWSPDMLTEQSSDVFTMPLTPNDRRMLVKLTTGYNEKIGTRTYRPRAAHVRRLMLSALGGDLEAQRTWTERPEGVDLTAWTHRAAIGRDYFVRVEYTGFLLPFRHRASLIKITERKFQTENGKRVARLRQRKFIIVRDRVMSYPAAAPNPFDGRANPFVALECLTDVTPDLAEAGGQADNRLSSSFYTDQSPDAEYQTAFWPAIPTPGGIKPLPFKWMGTDRSGRRVGFEMPLMFVSEVQNISDRLPDILEHYRNSAAARRTINLGAKLVTLASDGGSEGQSDYPAVSFTFEVQPPTSGIPILQSDALQAFPALETATVELPALEPLTGTRATSSFTYEPSYLNGGISGNTGGVFAQLTDPGPLVFGNDGASSDKAGAIATPNLLPSALSGRYGILSGGNPATLLNGQFTSNEFLPDAKIFGVFALQDLLPGTLDLSDDSAPKIKRTVKDNPKRVETSMRLVRPLASGEKPGGLIIDNGAQLTLETLVSTQMGGGTPSHTVTGMLTNFRIHLVGVIILRFDRLRFYKEDGRKPDIDVDLNPQHPVTFGGPLAFVNKVKDYIPSNGFSDPPDLQITPSGLTASYELRLPPMEIGVLSLSNVALGASFSLPFTGEPPTIRFNFADRHNTFNLTVSLLGGGGFVAIVVSTEGIKELEVQLDFGARVAIDLGVASGLVYYKGGFYFHYQEENEAVLFEGFVEIGGRLSVIGLISVSLTFHLSLAYERIEKPPKDSGEPNAISRLFGQATLVVEVEVLLWSGSVSITVEKTFIGSEADPTFVQLMETPAVWADYCEAFA
jgi:hypothetical protein